MIDRAHDQLVARQCQILSLARSTAHCQPQEISESDLALMRRIDELHLEYPFAGSRMLRDLLRSEGRRVGRRHVGTFRFPMTGGRIARLTAKHLMGSSSPVCPAINWQRR